MMDQLIAIKDKILEFWNKYKGTIRNMVSKSVKIEKLKNRLVTLRKNEKERNNGDER